MVIFFRPAFSHNLVIRLWKIKCRVVYLFYVDGMLSVRISYKQVKVLLLLLLLMWTLTQFPMEWTRSKQSTSIKYTMKWMKRCANNQHTCTRIKNCSSLNSFSPLFTLLLIFRLFRPLFSILCSVRVCGNARACLCCDHCMRLLLFVCAFKEQHGFNCVSGSNGKRYEDGQTSGTDM